MRAYEIYKQFFPDEPSKYKTTEQRKAETALEEVKKEGMLPKTKEDEELKEEAKRIIFETNEKQKYLT